MTVVLAPIPAGELDAWWVELTDAEWQARGDALRAEADAHAAGRPGRIARWRALCAAHGIAAHPELGQKYTREQAIADAGLVYLFDEAERAAQAVA